MKNYFFSGDQLFIGGKVIYHIIVETKFLEQKAFLIKWKLSRDKNEYPKKSFSHFLKYGETKESHVFTIDNTNALKKCSQLNRIY